MPFWTYQNLATLTQGHWLVPPQDESETLPAARNDTGPILWHDTREITPGQCYLAIPGENFDGHDFIDKAFAAGAALAIVQKSLKPGTPNPTSPVLRVEDTVKAMQSLARAYRDELKRGGCKVVGIAGSNGKTTTRHLIHHVLTHAGKRGTQSPKSFNNHLGVPLTLLAARPTDDFVAAEIGTNHPGEIDFLAEIAKPDIAVITSIGEEHLEFFKDLDGVLKEEFSIANYFGPDTLCIAGDEVPWVDSAIEQAYLRAEHYSEDARALGVTLDRVHAPTRICGTLAAWTALCLGVEKDAIAAAIASATPAPGRWQKLPMGQQLKLIHDAYNANPTSVWAAITALWEMRCARRVFVFGDMYELGETSVRHHQNIGQHLAKTPFDLFITIGPLARHASDAAATNLTTRHFDAWTDDLPDQIAALLQPGDTVLLKASRGMRLERLIPAIEARFGKADE